MFISFIFWFAGSIEETDARTRSEEKVGWRKTHRCNCVNENKLRLANVIVLNRQLKLRCDCFRYTVSHSGETILLMWGKVLATV